MPAFTVYLENEFGQEEEIDTVFFDYDFTEEDVKKSLIDHDGYDARIRVEAE